MTKKVLMMSHGVTGVTGFSNQLYLQARALADNDFDVHVMHRDYRGEVIVFPKDCNARTNSGRDLSGITMLPIATDQWGQDIFPWYINKYKVDYVHTLGDIWCYQFLKTLPKLHNWKWLAHYVFDTENMVSFWNESVQSGDISVVPSKVSYDMLKKLGHENAVYIPHGINTDVFKPATYEEKTQFRKELNIPEDAFVIGMIAHNQYRKNVPRLIDAFNLFQKKNPEAVLILHCLPRDSTGWDLPQIINDLGMGHKVFFTDKAAKGVGDIHVPEKELRKLYCAMDVHGLPTGGEGFGVPIVEAMACGIPNVATAYTTTNEFLCDEEDDKKVNSRGLAIPFVDIVRHHTGGYWASVNIPMMAQGFQYLKDNRSEANAMGMRARKFAVENYEIENVRKQWVDLYRDFDSIVEKLDDTEKKMNQLHLMPTPSSKPPQR